MYSIYTVLKNKSLRLATLPPCRKRVCSTRCELGSGREETPVTPDEPDALDAGDVLQGVGVDGLASGASSASSASGWVGLSAGPGTEIAGQLS